MGKLREVPLRKLASAGAVIVLHVLVLALWLSHVSVHRVAALRETIAVGLAEGVALPSDAFDRVVAQMRSMPPYHMTSMCNDLLRGNRIELPWFAGKVVELGTKHGIATPTCNLLYAALKPHINGKPN